MGVRDGAIVYFDGVLKLLGVIHGMFGGLFIGTFIDLLITGPAKCFFQSGLES